MKITRPLHSRQQARSTETQRTVNRVRFYRIFLSTGNKRTRYRYSELFVINIRRPRKTPPRRWRDRSICSGDRDDHGKRFARFLGSNRCAVTIAGVQNGCFGTYCRAQRGTGDYVVMVMARAAVISFFRFFFCAPLLLSEEERSGKGIYRIVTVHRRRSYIIREQRA